VAVTTCRHREARQGEQHDRVIRMSRAPPTVLRSAECCAHDPLQRWAGRIVSLGLIALLAACASPSTRSVGSVSAPRPTLVQERQRLADLFDGTPVVLAIDRDGSLRAEVPLRFCFEPARAVVKPPLAALLERLAASPATRGGTWLVAAPGDPASKGSTLASERAASVRDYLVGHGAQAANVAVGALASSGGPTTVVRVIVTAPSGKSASR